jgi:hypothetical protein
MTSIEHIHQALLAESDSIRRRGLTFADLVAQHNKNQNKNGDFTPEEKAAYKARKTSEALAHCQREREKAILRQKAAGFQL